MDQNQETGELSSEQLARELAERRLAESAPQHEEAAQHERRAEKAHYLREKLSERAESEREAAESSEDATAEPGSGPP